MAKNKQKKRKKRKNQTGHTPLKKHVRSGTKLKPFHEELPISNVSWERDWLPEYLWIASLREIVPIEKIHQPYYQFMRIASEFVDSVEPGQKDMLGLISDFAHLERHKDAFFRDHRTEIEQLFLEPVGRILAFFPDSPASWLIDKEFIEAGGRLDPDVEIPKLRSLVADLLDGRGPLATAVRMASFGQLCRSGVLQFPKGVREIEDTLDALTRYPERCSGDEKGACEAFVRSGLNGCLGMNERYQDRSWPMYFWRHNYDLTPCRPVLFPLRGSRPASKEEFEQIENVVRSNCEAARRYLDALALGIKYDIYAPEKGEVIHGLFARCVRLFLLLMENPSLWARDTAGIFLRCLVETTITFCYLAEHGSDDEFDSFRKYGDAQKKLIMLQLQDNHPDDQTLEGRDASDLSEELGGFSAELLQIELGNWAKKDARKLAYKAGLERFYRLVFTPSSADIHGTWASLKHSNLGICAEPLHRFHQVPTYAEPPLFPVTLAAATELLVAAFETGVRVLSFPATLELQELEPGDGADESSE